MMEEAPSNSNNNDIWEPDKNDEDLECAICTDVYKSPKLLKCMHTFCNDCIEQVLKHGDQKSVTCPKCRYSTKVGEDGSLNLWRNHVMEQKVEKQRVSRLRLNNALHCSDCGSAEAKALCNTCQLKLCDFCAEYHKRSIRFKDHVTSSIESVSNEDLYDKQQMKCTLHDQEIKYFCETCEVTTCTDCVHNKPHQGHVFVAIGEVADKKRGSLEEAVSKSDSVLKEYADYLKDAELFQKKSIEDRDASKERIENTFAELNSILQAEKVKLLGWLDDTYEASADATKRGNEEFNHVRRTTDYLNEVLTYPVLETFDIVQNGGTPFKERIDRIETMGQKRTKVTQTLPYRPAKETRKEETRNSDLQLIARQVVTNDKLQKFKTGLLEFKNCFTQNECSFGTKCIWSYEIDSISKVDDAVRGQPVTYKNHLWRIMLQPGYQEKDRKTMKFAGIFIVCEPKDKALTQPWRCHVEAEIVVKHNTGNDYVRSFTHDFCTEDDDWGFSSFIPWKDLINPRNGYCKNDSITLIAAIL